MQHRPADLLRYQRAALTSRRGSPMSGSSRSVLTQHRRCQPTVRSQNHQKC